MKQAMQVLTSSKTDEWLTPVAYIEMARSVLGSIDLDPASCLKANAWIQADRIFTKEDNGLKQEFFGNVFINPPFGKTGNKSNQELWARKLLSEFLKDNVEAAIILTKTVPGYLWWDWMFSHWPGPLCITKGRIAFVRPEWVGCDEYDNLVVRYPPGDNRSKAASSFWYLGPEPSKFMNCFGSIGRCLSSALNC